MPIYKIDAGKLVAVERTTFAWQGLRERRDMQTMLKARIEVLCPDTLVVAEEFGDWEDSRRRIDLLGIDKSANLVVIELKRSEDGGHMELQAIRYAAMISTLTFEKLVPIYARFLADNGIKKDAAESLLEFLDWSEPDEEQFAPDVRILLVSEDFGKELTTAVLWLRDRDIDIRCVRLHPYKEGQKILIDVQQIIPLPEAAEYQVQLREKEQVGRKQRATREELRLKFWEGLIALARARGTRHANCKPGPYNWISARFGIRGLGFNHVITKENGKVELYIDRGVADENKRIFDTLESRKAEIEAGFGGSLSWDRLDARRASRIKHIIERGGYRSPESQWPAIQTEMVEKMTRLEAALRPALDELDV